MAALTFQARFRQAGGAIDHTPSSAVAAGEVVVLGSGLLGIAHAPIAADALGSLIVAGVAEFVKVTGTIAIGIPVYWDEDGDPLGGTSGTGALTATSTSNSYVGFMVSAAGSTAQFGVVYMVPAISVTTSLATTAPITDPDDAGAIPVTGSGSVALVSGGVETRTLADPDAVGLIINIYLKTDGGTITLTSASPMNQAGNNTLAFADVGDSVQLIAIEDGADKEWRIMNVDGMTPTTV